MGIKQAAFTALAVCTALLSTISSGAAKEPGKPHCYGGVCHRVLTLAETAARVGIPTRMHASHYDSCDKDRFNTCGLTSSGEVFRPDRPDNAASSFYPDGTIILVYHAGTRNAAVLRVNSFGPFKSNRVLDVSRATAEKLGFRNSGVARVHVAVLKAPTAQETRYKEKRTYAPVPGFLGRVKSLDHALVLATSELGVELPPIKPIIATQSTMMRELPFTSTMQRYAAGAIGPILPTIDAALSLLTGKSTHSARPRQAAQVAPKLLKSRPGNQMGLGLAPSVNIAEPGPARASSGSKPTSTVRAARERAARLRQAANKAKR